MTLRFENSFDSRFSIELDGHYKVAISNSKDKNDSPKEFSFQLNSATSKTNSNNMLTTVGVPIIVVASVV